MNGFNKWFETFLEEKKLPYESWDLISETGTLNIIDTDIVIDRIKIAPVHKQNQIKDMIIKIDFSNGNINDFLSIWPGLWFKIFLTLLNWKKLKKELDTWKNSKDY